MGLGIGHLAVFGILLMSAGAALDGDEDDEKNSKGLFPNVFNLAATSIITVNATCGETGPEIYCKLVEHVFLREDQKHHQEREKKEPQCSICDSDDSSHDKRHPISNAIDGTNRWWQSPTLQNGKHFEWVTVTLDLGQVYQVAYVIVKAGISPRPGNWILERSLDGIIYKPWQYYAITDSECWEAYGIRPTVGKPHYRSDDEVICTSYYSKLNPLENGEIHTSLVNGRPGAEAPSMKLREFTKTRYVRLRLQKIRTLNADLMMLQTDDPNKIDKSVTRRYFYSIKDISVGGQCVCSGHAESCSSDSVSGKQQCKCEHNTCGENCEKCCPLYNQKPWQPGTSIDASECEKCECYGHADKCHYDESVANEKTSINTGGKYTGGGVCSNCKHHTTGINCEQCDDGYFRAANIPRNHTRPCKKCQCSGNGMTGICVKDDSFRNEGLQPGDCLCKKGFTGRKCDRCEIGYRNYPLCEPCPCHSAGTVGGSTCEGECVCKINVEGTRCDRCKHGYYHLSASNPDGCSQCFCFGLTDECVESDWGVELIKKIEDWRVTDIKGRRVVKPIPENGNLVIANDDMSQFSSYYWLAPPNYLGKKLHSYGADLKFTVSYVVARGDTSGTYTESSDIILEGNGEQIGYNWKVRSEFDSVAITLPLREQGWFILTPTGSSGGAVTREAFTLILNNLTRLLIRAKFHTDQIEGRLHDIGMEIASKESKSLKKLESVEKCVCPPGYDGLSCEECASGYRPSKSTGTSMTCERCDCNNHAEYCDADTGRCRNCLHNTTGMKCDRCVRGYYGDATGGTRNDCKRCACPLEIPENNFSPSCSAVESIDRETDYVCDLCPQGYEGDKCERCAEGYFGNPQIPGGYCQPCDCSNNADTSQNEWCDSLTGQCLKCLGNTGGWNCGECLPGHYGKAERRQCEPCSCNSHGSVSPQCDLSSGQCICKPKFVGRTCNHCADGYGNIAAGCTPCTCNKVGSRTESCDSATGHCLCKPGVFGVRCDSCLEDHYAFSHQGCRECNCNPSGALISQCDENSGQCSCKHRVTGRACDKCEDGFWNLNSEKGCEECLCNRTGAMASVCDKSTGQCTCKPGVGGKYCDRCLAGHFRFNVHGCRKCDPCDVQGHICDPQNGRCVCPPYTTGRRCENCVSNAWGYNQVTGCQLCKCNIQGSPRQTCDPITGNCMCLEGFEGRHCDQCRHGFYSFPNCNKCDCNMAGADTSRCQLQNGVCHCDDRGQCSCKENVIGKKCSQCVEGAFSLSAENSKGCHLCFCFGRTNKCNQANMIWSASPVPSRDVFMEIGTSQIPIVLGFQIIPSDLPSRRLEIPYVLDKPLYWSLTILGDKVLSYNGYLTFHAESHSGSHFPDALLHRYPLVVLQGNHRIVLVHSPKSGTLRMPYKVRMNEAEWRLHDNPQVHMKKDMLMVALQKVQAILIRATNGADVKYARLQNVSLDVAVSSYHASPLAEGVELCRCPRQYTGSSCQDPATGYYRKHKPDYLDSKDILDLVGWAEPCSCNNHTNICDKETGICIDCSGNTMGPNCDQCIKGHYGDPSRGPCRPCSCPLPTNSFSETCRPDAVDYTCIDCQTGYAGRHCEKCDSGYYGDPLHEHGRCVSCMCNPYGSKSKDCDQFTGQCQCQDGIQGRDCTVCSHGFILTEYGCKSCEDECTGILLNELYQLKLKVDGTNFTDIPRLPWGYLDKISATEKQLRPLVTEYQKRVSLGKELVNNFTFYFDLETQADVIFTRAKDYVTKAMGVSADAKDTLEEAEKLFRDLNKIWRDIKDLASELDRHGLDPTSPNLSSERLLREAERILLEIKNRNFIPDKENADRELRKALNLLNNVKRLTMDHGHLDDLKQKADILSNLLSDVIKRINEYVRKPAERAMEIVRTGRFRQNEVQGTVKGISDILDVCNKTLKEAADLLGKARSDIIDAAVKFEFLPRLLRDLENATDALDQHRSVLSHLNSRYKDEYVIPAQRHADDLEKQSRHLANLFTATRELSEFPLQAAKAYQNIIDAINASEIAAREADKAADNAYRQAYPDSDDALTEQADKAKKRSQKLLSEAQNLNDENVPELETSMRARQRELNRLGENVAYGKRTNDIINRELDALPKGVGDSLQETDSKQRIATGKANAANNKVDGILQDIEGDLRPRLDSILAGSVGGLENLTKIIQQAREDVKDASRLADNADVSSQRVRRQNSILQLNLKELKDKILFARQKASSIRVSLGANTEGVCARSFKPLIEPSTTNNIILNYAINKEVSNSMLFFMGNSKEEDFMAIEMVNRKVRFLWNAGGGTQVIQHNMTIETNSEQLLKNEKWFKIEANRIGNLATLSVKRTPEGQKQDQFEVTGASPVGFNKMDLDAYSDFFIGGFPENYLRPSEIRASSFAGCLYEVTLDGKPVGLWNFLSNIGCDGCKEGATEDVDISAYEFQGGNSYSIMPQIPYYQKSNFYAALSFRTLNEDALLLFSCNPKTGDYISVELRGGKVLYQLNFGGKTNISLQTNQKYNTGKWVHVEVAREKFQAQMLVDSETLEDLGHKQGSSVLDLQKSSLYYGGVPPTFDTIRWPGIAFTSFYGCLKDLQIDTTPFSLSRGSFYGMAIGCSNKAAKVATFKGSGYLELKGQPLHSDSSFAFSFLTTQIDAFLLLSTFTGMDSKAEKFRDYYSVALKDRKIEARLDNGGGQISMISDRVLSSGVFHTVNLIRKNRRLLLRIDDEEEAEIRLPRGAKDVASPKSGGLFFGGVKEGVAIENVIASPQKLIGIIKDVVFNDRLLRFEETVNHKGIDFGLPDIQSVTRDFLQQMALSHPRENCAPTYSAVEENAFRFDGITSKFLPTKLDKKELLKNFNLSVEFRTYQKEGILVAVSNAQKKQQLLMFLKDNHIAVNFRRKRERKSIVSDKEFNLGEWHQVHLVKAEKRLSLFVNKQLIAMTLVPKKMPFKSPLYVGGLPKEFQPESSKVTSNFVGCIRNLLINSVVKTLPTSNSSCFQKEEPGAYFAGNSFILQDTSFLIDEELVINLQFRTSNATGVLINLYDSAMNYGLKLQLLDGEVLVTIYKAKSSKVFQLSQGFKSKYEICDNQWHSVMTAFQDSVLTLKMDELKPVQLKVEKIPQNFGFVTLMIGGLKEKQMHSFSDRNFIGCLRNININGHQLRPEEAVAKSNVVLQSCPMV